MKHIVEVRLKTRMFQFFDFKGELIDHVVKETNGKFIKLSPNGSRGDIATEDLSKVFFFSYENFGFQLEAKETFDDFIQTVDELTSLMKSFPRYEVHNVARLGTKSVVLYHNKGDSFSSLVERYKKVVFDRYQDWEKEINSELSDVAYTFDVKRGQGMANILTGPVTKEEALQRFFGSDDKYKKFDKDNGLLFSIDYAKKDMFFEDITKLESEIKNNINQIKDILEGSIRYFS